MRIQFNFFFISRIGYITIEAELTPETVDHTSHIILIV